MRQIEICSNKMLLLQQNAPAAASLAAVLCTPAGLNPERYGWLGEKLILRFDDITEARNPAAFSSSLAERIVAFVRELPKQYPLFFCCDSGESRSAALAAAFLRSCGGDEMRIWRDPHYHPNPLVYRLQCEALGTRVTEEEVAERRAVSENALADAIRKARRE